MKGVHKYKNVWWFWNGQEKTKRRIGSYTSKVGAEVGLQISKENQYQQSQNLLVDENLGTIDELVKIINESNCSCADEIQQCSHCSEMKHSL